MDFNPPPLACWASALHTIGSGNELLSNMSILTPKPARFTLHSHHEREREEEKQDWVSDRQFWMRFWLVSSQRMFRCITSRACLTARAPLPWSPCSLKNLSTYTKQRERERVLVCLTRLIRFRGLKNWGSGSIKLHEVKCKAVKQVVNGKVKKHEQN